MKLSQKKIENICKEYKDFIDSPFSDGYTVAYLEGKFNLTIDEMEQIYNENRPKKKLTKEELLKQISAIAHKSCCFGDTSQINSIRELLEDNGYTE